MGCFQISGSHGRSQDFFGGGTIFQIIFKKYSKNFQKIFEDFLKCIILA